MRGGSSAAVGRCPGWPVLFLLLLTTLSLCSCRTSPHRFESEALHRLNRWPAAHTGRAVILQGVAAGPLRSPQGGALGSYHLQDGEGRSVRVLCRRLPRVGRTYRVAGLVGQAPENALQPLVLELSRIRPLLHPSLILGLMILVLGSLVPTALRLSRLSLLPGTRPSERSDSDLGSGPEVRPGVAYQLELTVVEGPDTGRRHTFRGDRILVGRPGLRDNDLCLDDSTVSRKQAVIIRDNRIGGYKIRNEGWTNPLKVNGRPCDAVALRHGDRLTVGLTTLEVAYLEPDRESSPDGTGRPLLLLLALLALLTVPGAARPVVAGGGGGSMTMEQLDLQDLPEVTCRFRVFTAVGGARLGLGPGDFRLLVDGRPLDAVDWRSHLVPGGRLPRLALVVQATPELRGRGLFLLKAAITGFLERWPHTGELALVSHGTAVQVEQGFTTERERLVQRLESLRLSEGGPGVYYAALERAAALFGEGESGLPGALLYFCEPGTFQREDMRPEAPGRLRHYPGLPVYPVLLPQRDGSRTRSYLQHLALKLTEGLDGHYTLQYRSPGGEDNRVHSLRIERMPPGGGEGGGTGCRYRAISGSGVEAGDLLAAADRRWLLQRLAGLLGGLLAGGLALRRLARRPGPAGRTATWRRAVKLARIHFLLAGALAGALLSQLIGLIW